MIIKRALFREAAQTSLAIIAVLTVLMLFFGLTQTLGLAAMGKRAAQTVFQLVGLETIRALDTLAPLAFFLGILLTVSRWYRDSEIAVLSACGISLVQLLRPVMLLATCFFVLGALNSLYLSPLAVRHMDAIKQQARQRVTVDTIEPGVFRGSKTGGRVFYVEGVDEQHVAFKGVFVSAPVTVQDGIPKASVVVAATGRHVADEKTGENLIVLENGTSYEGVPGEADYRIVTFEKYTLRLEPQEAVDAPPPIEGIPTSDLFGTGKGPHNAELQWRVARPVAIFVLAVFALVLAHTDTRKGRSGNVLVAVLVFFIYANLLGVGAGLLKRGELPAVVSLWGVHAGFALLASYLLTRRNQNRPIFAIPRP